MILSAELLGKVRKRPGQVTDSAADRGMIIGRPRDAVPAAAPPKSAAEIWMTRLVDLLTQMMNDPVIVALIAGGKGKAAPARVDFGGSDPDVPSITPGARGYGAKAPSASLPGAADHRALDSLLPARRSWLLCAKGSRLTFRS